MDRSKTLTIIPQPTIARMAESDNENEILAMLLPGLDALGHDGLMQVEREAHRTIAKRYPDDSRAPVNWNAVRRWRQKARVSRAIDHATLKVPEALADAAKRVRKAAINRYVARAELAAYQAERQLERMKAADKAEEAAQELLAQDGAHQAAMALARQDHNHAVALRQLEQPHEIALKKEEQVVPLEVTRMKTGAEVEVAKIAGGNDVLVAQTKAYAEAETARFRSLIAVLTAEKDEDRLTKLITDFTAAQEDIAGLRNSFAPLWVEDIDPATGRTIARFDTAEANMRSKMQYEALLEIVKRWQGTIGKGR